MNKLQRSIILTGIILLQAMPGQAAESLSVLLQKGIFAEETEGNLDAAIQIYEGIVKEAATNRSLVAQAQYRLGVCQVKKGKKDEATAAFRTLLDQHPNEAELIVKTRARLTELGQPASSVLVRQVWAPATDTEVSVSSDGKLLAFVDWESGDLAIRDLASGKNRRLTNKGSWEKSDEFAMYPVLSRDGRQIFYCWYNNEERFDLRVVSVENPEPRVLLNERNESCNPEDWSPDGKQLVAQIQDEKTKEYRLTLFSPDQGGSRTLKTLGHLAPSAARFSSNGRFVVYGRRPSAEIAEDDIFLLAVADGTETPLTQHPANDEVLGWAPDGRTLLFSSDRRGSTDVWSVQVSEGKVIGEPTILKSDLGTVHPVGVTLDGRFFYGVSRSGNGIYRARIDFETGKVTEPPTRIPLRSVETIANMSLSPNGRNLVFTTRRGSHSFLSLLDLESRRQRELLSLAPYRWNNSPQWLRDDRTIVFRGHRKEGGTEFCLLDTVSGQMTSVAIDQTGPNVGWMGAGIEDQRLFYVRWDAGKASFFVVQRDPKSGEEHAQLLRQESDQTADYVFHVKAPEKVVEFIRTPPKPSNADPARAFRFHIETGRMELVLSLPYRFEPRVYHNDPSRIAVVSRDEKGVTTVRSMELKDGQAQERFAVKLPEFANVGWWSPGGRELLFLKRVRDANNTVELWGMSSQTGELRKTDLSMPRIQRLGPLNFASNELFFQVGEPGLHEVWVMENFLPPVAAAR